MDASSTTEIRRPRGVLSTFESRLVVASQRFSYCVGERTLVWIAAGKRLAILLPKKFLFKRHGLDFVRVASGADASLEAVVQVGRGGHAGAGALVEVLARLNAGDRLLQP